MTAAGVD